MSLNQSPFLTNANYQSVVGFLRKHYAGRMGTQSIPERMDGRIQKTVQHFMTEVARIHGVQKPVQQLDQEVVRAATQSLDEWLKRNTASEMSVPPPAGLTPQVIPKATTVSAAAYSRPRVPATPTGVPASQPIATVPGFEEVNALFSSKLGTAWPEPVEEEQEDPVLLMKKAQKQRETEMLAGKVEPRMEVAELATSSVDPTPQAQPPPVRTTPLPQDYIIPQEPVVKYRNKEYNIFLTSSDRDWFRNRTENRYNFSVTFNPGNRPGYGYSPSVQERFRNIERIEFVKAIVPTESLVSLVRSTGIEGSAPVLNSDRIVNVLSLPFAGVRIAELNNNGFSTNPREDNTFALVQYDAVWNSNTAINPDPSATTAGPLSAVGYTAMIPKFLKSQRVYEPTPLAGLQKLTFRMERHDGALLSNECDVYGIQRICLSSTTTGITGTDSTNYAGTANEFIYIQTSAYFPGSAVSEGDIINLQGYTVAPGTALETTRLDFEAFMNNTLNVVAIAHVDPDAGGSIDPGTNVVGYANVIIVRSRFDDPTTGAIGRDNSRFGGDAGEEAALATDIDGQASTADTAAMLNLSRQTHFVLRVITRDMDSAANIRPDNV